MNPGRYWTGIPSMGWLVVVVVVVRRTTVVVVIGGGVGCRTTSSLVHDPKENATRMKEQSETGLPYFLSSLISCRVQFFARFGWRTASLLLGRVCKSSM